MVWPHVTDEEVVAARPAKTVLDPWKPYAFLVEPEYSPAGTVDNVLTVFLTNRECPFRCTMCDLWKYTLDERVPPGAIPAQVEYAVQQSSPTKHIKLYNAGNFFDAQAIPADDHVAIAALVEPFSTVIVENHPRLTDERCLRFRDRLQAKFEIALGLETIHPTILPSLNKRMSLNDFEKAVTFLRANDIDVRTFVLLKPPGLNEMEGIDWALRSLQYAVNLGAGCVSLIPTRVGNGLMEQLQAAGQFSPPTIRSMEAALEQGLQLVAANHSGVRVFMDVWDAATFFDCSSCGPARAARIERMNLSQQVEPPIRCEHCANGSVRPAAM